MTEIMEVWDVKFPNKECMIPLQLNSTGPEGFFTSATMPELDRNEVPGSRIWELEDLLPMYPDQDIPNIQTYITAKKEFIEKSAKQKEDVPERGHFFSYQELFHRYGMHYDRIFNMQKPGTGKTGAAGGLAQKIRRHHRMNEIFGFIDLFNNRHRSNINGVIILVNNKLLRNEFRNQLIYKYSLPGEYDLESLQNKEAGSRSKAISSMLSDFITIETYRKFSSKISSMGETLEVAKKTIIERYSDKLIIGDEIHNIRIESGEGVQNGGTSKKKTDKRRQAITYGNLHYAFHVILRSKIILMSATVSINDAAEVADILNLILPLDKQLPIDRETFKEMSIDDLEPYYRGKISYVRESGTYLIQKHMGEYISGNEPGSKFVYNIGGKKYVTSKQVYTIPMITDVIGEDGEVWDKPTQGKVYIEHIKNSGLNMNLTEIETVDSEEMINASELEEKNEDTTDNVQIGESRNNNFFRQTGKLKQISNGIFPDGSYGTEGFNKYIKFDELINDYVGTPELIENIRDINHLRILSNKYADIIEILKIVDVLPGPCYAYTHLKLGSGAYYLGICLEQHGFEKYRGISYPFKNDPKTVPFNPACSLSMEDNHCDIEDLLELERKTEISDSFPKKLRYAILTSNINDTEINNIMELYNSAQNINGEYLKFLIITPFGREGINLAHSMKFILIDPGWNPSSEFQAKNRGIRELSHIYKIAQLKELYPNNPDIKLEIEIYNMCAYVEGVSISWELSLYQLSESKDIEIKINERYMKMIAFDKELHKRRNERVSDVGKEGTDECDYSTCTYPMYDPLPPIGYIDYTTYDILYSDELVNEIISKIKTIFKRTYNITLNELFGILKDFRKKSIVTALEKMIVGKIPMVNRIGNISYLYEDGENLFIYNEFPISSNLIMENTYSLNYYNKYPTVLDIQNIEDYISDDQIASQNKIFNLLYSDSDIGILSEMFDKLSFVNKIKIFEDLVVRDSSGDSPSIAKYIFNKYAKSFFTEKEPTRDIISSSQKLSSINQDKSKPGRKKKNVPAVEVNLEMVSPYRTAIPAIEAPGENVIFHILYGDLQSKSTISVSPTFKNAEGRIRLFKKSTGFWRDANDYESPVYRAIIVERRKDDIEKFKEKGLYGTILDDKFRIVNNPNNLEFMDGRKSKKGSICKNMHKDELTEIMYILRIDLSFLPRLDPFNTDDAEDFLIKKGINTSNFSTEQIRYYYYVLISRITRNDLCDVIYEDMDLKGLIYKV